MNSNLVEKMKATVTEAAAESTEGTKALWDPRRGKLTHRHVIPMGPAHDVLEGAREAMVSVNRIAPDPVYFVKDEQLTYRRPREGKFFTPTSEATLGNHLDENLFVLQQGAKGKKSAQKLSKDLLSTLMEDPPHVLPKLKAVVGIPFVSRRSDGSHEIITQHGFHTSTGVWLDLPAGLTGIAAEIEKFQSIGEAVAAIFDDLLIDFKSRWPSRRDQAHHLAIMCEPFVRAIIAGPTPLNFFSAEDAGSGKSILARFHGAVAFGIDEKLTLSNWTGSAADDDDFVKTFPGTAARNPPYIFMDNLKKPINSGILAGIVTEGSFTCNVKYLTAVPEFDIRWQWLQTGNKPNFDRDLARRMLRVNIKAQPKAERPSAYRWSIAQIAASRSRFAAAILYICREGLNKGTTEKAPFFDSFDGYMRVLWPIMVNAGFTEFDPASNVENNISDDGVAWEAFARLTFQEQRKTGNEWVYAKALWADVVQAHTLDIPGMKAGASSTDHGASVALGKALSHAPRTMGPYRLEYKAGRNGHQYHVELVGEDPHLFEQVPGSLE